MRTTIQLDDDVDAAIALLRKTHGFGLSEAVNELIRRGLRAPAFRREFVQRTAALGIRVDVTNIGEALDFLEGADAR